MIDQEQAGLFRNTNTRPDYFPRGTRIMAPDPIGWWGEVGTMLKYQYSPAYSALESLQYDVDENFRPEEHLDFDKENIPYLMNAKSLEHLQFLRNNEVKQLAIKQDMRQVRWHSMLVGAMADPLTWLIPFSLAGKGIYAGVMSGARAGAGYGILSETIRAPFDPTNTSTETITNIAGGAVFGGALGGVVRTPSAILRQRRAVSRATKDSHDILNKFETKVRTTKFKVGDLAKKYSVNFKVGPLPAKTLVKGEKPQPIEVKGLDAKKSKQVEDRINKAMDDSNNLITNAVADLVKAIKNNFGSSYGKFAQSIVNNRNQIAFGSKGKKPQPIPLAKYNRDTNTVFIDDDALIKSFNEKRWTKPRMRGVKPLPEETFQTPEEWRNFVVMHEVAHSTTKKMAKETTAKYENRINKKALKMLDEEQQIVKDNTPIKDEYDLALPNVIGNIVSTPYRKAIQFVGKNKKKLPQEIKRLFHMGFADGGVLTKGMMAGRSVISVQQLKGKAFGLLGEVQYALENLHYQQVRNLKVNRDVEAPRGYFGYKYRDKMWTKPDGNTFGEFLERTITYYMLNVSEATMKGIDGVDLSFLRFNEKTHFAGKPITKYEKEASQVIKDFFENYRKEAMDAGLFDMAKEVAQMKKFRDRYITSRVNRLSKLIVDSQTPSKKTLKNTQYYRSRLQDAEADLKTLNKKIDDAEKQMKDGKFTPPFEENYFSRIWDTGFILKHKDNFIKLVDESYKAIPYKLIRDRKTGVVRRKEYDQDPVKRRQRAEKFVDELLAGDTVEDMSQIMAPLQVAGLHPRNLNAPNWFGYKDVDGEIWRMTDFMITDPMAVMRNYTFRVAPKIEFKKMFGGTAKEIQDSIEARMTDDGFDGEDIAKVKTYFDVLYRREVGQVYDRPLGADNEFSANVRALGTTTFLSDSGRASIVDAGNAVFQYGFKPFQMAMERMVDRTAWKASKATRAIGSGITEKHVLGTVSQKVVDNANTHPVTRTWGRARDSFVDFSMDLNFLRPLTTYMKEMIGNFSQHDIIDKSLRYSQLTPFEKANLARHGIGEKQARLIATQKKFFEQDVGKTRWYSNIDKWQDQRAKDAFMAGHQTYINLGSLTATSADKFSLVDGQLYVKYRPFMAKFGYKPDPMTSAVGQDMIRFQSGAMALPFMFWNYGLAANQKILQAGFDPTRPLSQRLFGASMMIGLGYIIASWRVPDYMWEKMSYSKRMARAVHLSGVTGMYSDLAYMAIHMTKGAGFKGPQNEFAMYNPDTYDAFMEPFGAGFGLLGDYGRGLTTMATDSIPKGLAQIPFPLQYNMFIRDEVREMRRMLRNM